MTDLTIGSLTPADTLSLGDIFEIEQDTTGSAYATFAQLKALILAGFSSGVISVNGATGAVIVPAPIIVACSDEGTALVVASSVVTFRMPYAFTLTGVRASLGVAQTSGALVTVNIKKGGVSILSVNLTFDNGERTTVTAATQAIISSSAIADDSEMTVDIVQVGDGTAKGLKVTLIGYKP